MLRRQLHSARRFLPENLAEGMKLFIRGLGLKAILANQFGSLWANAVSYTHLYFYLQMYAVHDR